MTRVLAIDVGGTKLACAVVDADGTLKAERRSPTPRTGDPEALFAAVAAVARAALAESAGR